MNFNKLLVATALTAAAMSAQASVNISTSGNTTTYTDNINGGTVFSSGYYNTPFSNDDYLLLSPLLGSSSSGVSFVTGSSNSNVTVSFYYSALATAASWTFDGVTKSLANTNANLISFLATNPGANAPAGSDALASFSWSNLAGTNHSLQFNSGVGGLKIDDVKVIVTAVPEPETYALMLAGLMMVGTIARRRSRTK